MIDVEIEDDGWTRDVPDADDVATRAAVAVLAAEAAQGAITVLLTNDDTVADLNLRFRSKPGPTNVLSFPLPPNPEARLGDIALAHGVCVREAAEQGKPLTHHLSHLVAHGVLHLLGYDHETDAEAEDMEARERRILAPLGVPDPYAAERSAP